MSEKYHPDRVLVAILHLSDSLPFLVGNAWSKIVEQFDDILELLIYSKNIDEKRDLSLSLVNLLAPYEDTMRRLDSELSAITNTKALIHRNLASFADEFQMSNEDLDYCIFQILRTLPAGAEPDETTRHIRIKPYGLNTSTSMKLSNIDLSIFQIASLTGVALTTAASAAEKLNPLIITIGILTTILSIAQASIIKIEEQDASVLWGFILARDQDWIADEEKIILYSNRARSTIGFGKLKDEKVLNSLNKLKSLNVVEKVRGKTRTWKLKESFSIIK